MKKLDLTAITGPETPETGPEKPAQEKNEAVQSTTTPFLNNNNKSILKDPKTAKKGIVSNSKASAKNTAEFNPENLQKTAELRAEIIKAMQRGAPLPYLLLKAGRCITLTTGDQEFYKQLKENLQDLYGVALGYCEPLDQKIKETEKRLTNLEKARARVTDPAELNRINNAIKAHKKELTELEQLSARSEATSDPGEID